MVTIVITTYRASDTLGSSAWYAWADNGLMGQGDSEVSAVKSILDTLEAFYGVNCAATRTR